MAIRRFGGLPLAGFSLLLAGIVGASVATAADSNIARITILYDAFGKSSPMEKDWGYSALVEYRGKRILFDTGNSPEILAKNAKVKGADLSRLDFVVLSHRHGGKLRCLRLLIAECVLPP
jgi:7,8-dihydropterin-6-yl-methyl-4-(beta-D-ribofuranosyl)aminobenzene 5'-phosphate synthase